jgi:hypothetical protein
VDRLFDLGHGGHVVLAGGVAPEVRTEFLNFFSLFLRSQKLLFFPWVWNFFPPSFRVQATNHHFMESAFLFVLFFSATAFFRELTLAQVRKDGVAARSKHDVGFLSNPLVAFRRTFDGYRKSRN